MGTLVLVAIGSAAALVRAEDKDEKPKYTIKEVMKKAHKDGLMKKLAAGDGTKEDAETLVSLYEALGKNKPPKGDAKSWMTKTKTLVEAAKEVLDKKPGAGEKLQKAANCAECHKAHKPA
jgi:hypothetical protein